MAYSAAVKQALRDDAIAEVKAIKDTARQAYDSLATVSGKFAAMPTKYAGVFNPSEPEDLAVIQDFQATQVKVDAALVDLQTQGINALGTDSEV